MRASLARREGATRLRDAGVASPERDADLLLAHVLDVPLGRLPLVDDLDARQREQYDALLERRAGREPLQHLTGSAAFRHVELAVGPGVFVPRPETELLAGWAIEEAAALDRPVMVDLCTGSGAVAKAIADEVPAAAVHAVELDEAAYVWAERNLAGTGVDLREGDMATAFDDLAGSGVDLRHDDMSAAFPDLDGTVDVVLCNPPYLPLEAYESVEPEA
ncbi:MAG TPA: HemK/PrmC family methyltransferase, partial [Ornithinibacter sp.]|nr:HemK/PrmC family methyltransferase [Ornithinibacter sp.]